MHTGTLPNAISSLSSLQHLYLSDNMFTGTELCPLSPILLELIAHNAHKSLAGTLPNAIGECSALKTLDLSNNKFTGEPVDQ